MKKQLEVGVEPDENEPYCTDCGSTDLKYLDQYANGQHWECKDCGKTFMHQRKSEDE